MRHSFLPLLLILPWLLAPVVTLGANAKPKAAGADRPTGGDRAGQQPTPDQPPTDSKTDSDADKVDREKGDAEKADTEKPDADQPQPRKTGARPTSMAIISDHAGQKTLTIHFRWSLFPNASIEVRLVPGPNPKGVTVSPIYFSEHLKGKVQEELYNCLDHPGQSGRTYSFTKDNVTYKMIGRLNSLDNQGVHVQVYPEGRETLQRSSPKAPPPGTHVQALPHLEDDDKRDTNPGAAYLQLDTWAVNRDTLSLDLARDEFADSGTLFVWFFRGDQVVWDEQIRWPGYK